MQRPGCRFFANTYRISTTHEITSEERFLRNDGADLVEADHRGPQGGHLGLVCGAFLPTSSLHIIVDDVTIAVVLTREEILKGTSPYLPVPGFAHHRRKRPDCEV